jgi:hypothetical protein
MRLISVARLAALGTASVFAACGCASGSGPASAPAAAANGAPAAASAAPSLPKADQASLTALFAAAHLPAVKWVTYNADTDPNKELGRPNGYSAFVCWVDTRIDATDPRASGAQAGGCVETWPKQSDAQSRADYIQSVLKGAPVLGSEYDYVRGDGQLLRVSGLLTPAQAQAYKSAFGA